MTDPSVIAALPRALSQEEIVLVSASNGFGLRLLQEVRDERGAGDNVFISPLSVSFALGMAANGAVGETLDSIKAVLGAPDLDRARMNSGYRGLMDLLLTLDRSVEVEVASSTWARAGVGIRPSFVDRVQTYFDAHVEELDFADPAALDIVNGWVGDRTHGRIEGLVDRIEPSDIVLVLNAVYFKGAWTNQFDVSDTRDGRFELEDGTNVNVPLMSADLRPLRFYRGSSVEVGELTYGGGAYAMSLCGPARKRHAG